MKCICMRNCQVRIEGKIHTIVRGEVREFDKCPANFKSIEKEEYIIDFTKAGEQELMEAKWTFKAAATAIMDEYNIKLKKETGTKKSEIVAQILDARYRSITKRKEEI